MNKRIDYAKASPEGFKAFGGVYVYLQKCGLSKQLVDLVYLRLSALLCAADRVLPARR